MLLVFFQQKVNINELSLHISYIAYKESKEKHILLQKYKETTNIRKLINKYTK